MLKNQNIRISLPKRFLIISSLLYFGLCIAGGMEVDSTLQEVVVYVIFIFLFITVMRSVLLLIFGLKEKHTSYEYESNTLPTISIIVPAYNEEDVIEGALKSLIHLKYPEIEIIVVDDGSSDNTYTRARLFADLHPKSNIQVISQTNAGKSSALNTGVLHASGEFFLCVDADSRIIPRALNNVLHHFKDPGVGAVGGFVGIGNARSMLILFQKLEYIISLNFLRKGLSYFGAVTVIPGPVGLFRREAFLEAGGYREDKEIFAEDADITVRLLSMGWKVKGDQDLIAFTEAPQDIFSLLRQRYRWKRGVYQSFSENLFYLLTSPGYRGIFIAFFLAFESFALEIMNFGVTLFFLSHFMKFGEIHLLAAWYLVILGLEFTILVYAVRNRKNLIAWFLVQTVQRFSYSYLLQAWGVLALFDEWRSTKMSWDKLERLGNLS